MSVPPSPDHNPVIPDQAIPAQHEQAPQAPIQAQNPPDQDDDYLDAVDFGDDEDEDPYEDLVDEEENDPDNDPEEDENMIHDDDDDMDMISDSDEEEEDPLQADVIHVVSPPPLSPVSPLTPANSEVHVTVTPITEGRPYIIGGPSSTYEVGGPSNTFPNFPRYEMGCLRRDVTALQNQTQFLTRGMHIRQSEISSARTEAIRARDRADLAIMDMRYIRDGLTHVEDTVLDPITGFQVVKDKVTHMEKAQDKGGKQISELRHRLASAETMLEIARVDRYRLEIDLYTILAEMHAMYQDSRGYTEYRPTDSIDVLATYGNDDQPEPQQQSPDS